VEAANRPGPRHHCDHSRISPAAPHPLRGLNHRGVAARLMVNANVTPHGHGTSDGPSRNPAATWCTDATPTVIGPVRRMPGERLPKDGHVVTEREPEANGADAPDPPLPAPISVCRDAVYAAPSRMICAPLFACPLTQPDVRT
jgi:hypothetical protein